MTVLVAESMGVLVDLGGTVQVGCDEFLGLGQVVRVYPGLPLQDVIHEFVGLVAQHRLPTIGKVLVTAADVPVPEAGVAPLQGQIEPLLLDAQELDLPLDDGLVGADLQQCTDLLGKHGE